MSFILFIIFLVLIFGLVILLSVLGFVRTILSSIFGFGRRKNTYQTEPNQQHSTTNKQGGRHKIFEKSEGEYVDYEEVKD